MPIPIYLINLDRSVDRLQSIQEQMNRLRLPFERVPAVDGERLEETAPKHFTIGDAKPLCGRDLTLGEIGCSMSHLQIYERIVKAEQKYALILEDDVWLPRNTKQLIKELIEWNKPQHWDIVLLHHKNPGFRKFSTQKINHRMRLVRFKRTAASTAAYIVSYKTAKHLLRIGEPIRMPADKLTGDYKINHLKICGILCSPFSIDDFDTTIPHRLA